jgi:hypothetical protein
MVVNIGLALDLAWQHPDYSIVRKLGYKTVIRYVSHDPSKDLTLQELADIRNNGLDVALVYETFERRPMSGWVGGVNDAQEMRARLTALQLPPLSTAYYAVDFPPTAGEMPTVLEYARGWAETRGPARAGVYGNVDTIHAIDARGFARYLWQTSGNSRGVIVAGINLYQNRYDVPVAGAQVDINEIYTVDHGQIIWPKREDDSMTPITVGPYRFGIPPNGDYTYPIPPVQDGELNWGPCWLSVAADTLDVPYRFRVASKTLTSPWAIHTGAQTDKSGLTTLKSGDLWEVKLPPGTRMISLWGPWLLDGNRAPFSLFASLEYGQR